tara:strand:- start:865 stop:2367 length:1503 start_codon:yes stop_codon:yes gene_type:complete
MSVFIFCYISITLLFADPIDYNIQLLSVVEYENSNNDYGVSDVWGYTDEYGNEYAIVGYQFGTSILDVSTDLNNPTEVANILGPSNGDYYYHRDYKTFGDYLYIVNEMTGPDVGMQVIDLSPLPFSSPIQLNTYSEISQSHNLWIDDSGLAFIEHQSGDNIHIANLNPFTGNPTYGGTFGSLANNCHDIYTRDNIAYISEGWSYQFGIYDFSNPNNIIQLATFAPFNSGYAHNAWLNDSGTHIVTTEETPNKTVKIWDVSDFSNITVSGEYLGENGLAHNVHIKNDLVYISHYSVGIKIIDIYNPSDPIEVAAYDTYPQGNGSGYVGCWGAYPFTNNNMVFASDMQNGLYVFNFEPTFAGWISGTVYYSENNIIPNIVLRSLLNGHEYVADENGHFNFGFPQGMHEFELYFEDEIIDTVELEFLPRETMITDIFIDLGMNLGDLNFDQNLDILDIVIMVNIILDIIVPSSDQILTADMNNDLLINIQDIILLVNEILNRN